MEIKFKSFAAKIALTQNVENLLNLHYFDVRKACLRAMTEDELDKVQSMFESNGTKISSFKRWADEFLKRWVDEL